MFIDQQLLINFRPWRMKSMLNFSPVTRARSQLLSRRCYCCSQEKFIDVLIIDTAGRLAVDEEMMEEIKQVHQVAKPAETLFVVDAMIGQDSVNTAKAFNETLPLTGVVLTKVDGDAGWCRAIGASCHRQLKFLGVGEKTDALEPFHPQRDCVSHSWNG